MVSRLRASPAHGEVTGFRDFGTDPPWGVPPEALGMYRERGQFFSSVFLVQVNSLGTTPS